MANTTKVQPGLEAETAVIGALIYAPEIVKDVLFAVREQDFGIEINRKIFRAARDLYLRAKPVTAVTIRDKVGQESSDYLAQLYQLTMTSANWREYAAIMAEQASMRRMQEIAMQVAAAGTAQECRELAAKLQQEQSGGRQITAYTMEDMIRGLRGAADSQRSGAVRPLWSRRGGRRYIHAAGRCGHHRRVPERRQDGAGPPDGAADGAEWRVGFFSLETDRRKVTDRVVAALNDISFTAIKRRELTDKDWERFAAKSAAASALKFTLIEAAGWSVSDITERCRGLRLRRGRHRLRAADPAKLDAHHAQRADSGDLPRAARLRPEPQKARDRAGAADARGSRRDAQKGQAAAE